jgi:hypothetical protein
MPSYGEVQKPAGVVKSCGCPPIGPKTMKSNNAVITPTLGGIAAIEYKGNPVLNANKS